jgi:hypothetical protein
MRKKKLVSRLKTRKLRLAVAAFVVVAAAAGWIVYIISPHTWTSLPAVKPVDGSAGPAAVTVVAAGDISCEPDNPEYNAGSGSDDACQAKATSDLALKLAPDFVLTLGDEQYRNGSLPDFESSYDKTWGRLKSITKPVAGNHEYNTFGAAGYYDYFGAAAGLRGAGYYSYDLGDWHVVALNANCPAVGGCEKTSLQEQWLRRDLAANPRTCTLVYWHQPRFSSGGHGDDIAYQAFWEDLQDYHADVVLTGHDHDYERFAPQRSDGTADPNGVTEFVVGTGGESLTALRAARPNSLVRDNRDYGVLKLVLDKGRYDWQFVTTSGETKDSGSASCVTKPAGPVAPTPLPTPRPTPRQ